MNMMMMMIFPVLKTQKLSHYTIPEFQFQVNGYNFGVCVK